MSDGMSDMYRAEEMARRRVAEEGLDWDIMSRAEQLEWMVPRVTYSGPRIEDMEPCSINMSGDPSLAVASLTGAPSRETPQENMKRRMMGLNPDDPVETNEIGGQQSATGYRLDLLDPKAILRLGAVLKEGVEKGYKKNNWMKIPCDDHINHALGHIMAYLDGSRDEDHLGHAFCRLMFAVRMEIEEEEQWG